MYVQICGKSSVRDSDSTLLYCSPEAAAQRCFVKKVFLQISQNSQENTCARNCFLIKKNSEIQKSSLIHLRRDFLYWLNYFELAEASKKTIDHKTIFFFNDVLIVRVAAKFLLLSSSYSCCWWLNFLLPLRKLLLTSVRLIKLQLKKKNIVRKSWIRFTWHLFVGSRGEKSWWY